MDLVIPLLKSMKGVVDLETLHDIHRWEIERMEKTHNLGVHEVLKRDEVLILIHDSDFREAAGELVTNRGQLPPVPFPEIDKENVVSASPCKEVHDFILKQYGFVDHPEYATVLIGFDS